MPQTPEDDLEDAVDRFLMQTLTEDLFISVPDCPQACPVMPRAERRMALVHNGRYKCFY